MIGYRYLYCTVFLYLLQNMEKQVDNTVLFFRMHAHIFPDSSVVEQLAVNQLVVGSNPTQGAKKKQTNRSRLVFLFPLL